MLLLLLLLVVRQATSRLLLLLLLLFGPQPAPGAVAVAAVSPAAVVAC
jgi:hypothetical protein